MVWEEAGMRGGEVVVGERVWRCREIFFSMGGKLVDWKINSRRIVDVWS